jgi:hypothetical protein
VIADAYRPLVFLSAGRVRATVLVDGMVRGAWRVEQAKRAAALIVEPFEALANHERDALREEGERLVRFIEDHAETHEVRFAEGP